MTIDNLPKVAVLLAAYNGMQWIEEQVNSILNQQEVDVTLFISVDFSTDGTDQWVRKLTKKCSNVVMLPYGEHFGSAAKNFYNLIKNVSFYEYDYISLSDQDDVWLNNKLINAINEISSTCVSCYASNLTCFTSDGKEWCLVKSHNQKSLDYLFQGASAGCTYVLNVDSANLVKEVFLSAGSGLDVFYSHDWLIYAVTRSRGVRWYIDDNSYIRYRQHERNVHGARTGFSGVLKKFSEIKLGVYRNAVLSVEGFLVKSSAEKKVLECVGKYNFLCRVKLVFSAFKFRRRSIDAFALAFFIIFGVF